MKEFEQRHARVDKREISVKIKDRFGVYVAQSVHSFQVIFTYYGLGKANGCGPWCGGSAQRAGGHTVKNGHRLLAKRIKTIFNPRQN